MPENPDEKDLVFLQTVIETVRSRVKTLSELAEASTYFYRDQFDYDAKGVQKHFKKEGTAALLRKAAETLEQLSTFDLESTEAAYRNLAASLEISTGRLIHPTRLALSGRTMGPGLFELMVVLGRERAVKRLLAAASYIEKNLA